MPLGMEVCLRPGDFVLDGALLSPPQKGGGAPPIFDPCLLWPNSWMDQDGTWHGDRPQPRPLSVKWGPSPLPKPSQFSAHFYCGQTTGCIKMPLGMDVGISRGNFMFDGDPAPSSQKGAEPPIFGPRLLWPNGCMDQAATWYRGRPRPAYVTLC